MLNDLDMIYNPLSFGCVVLPLRFEFRSCLRDQKVFHFLLGRPQLFAQPEPAQLLNIKNQEDNEQKDVFL